MLNIKINNLGNIKEADIKIGNITIFAGPNNSGKTYINYLLYALLNEKYGLIGESYHGDIKKLKDDGILEINLYTFIDDEYSKLKQKLEKNFLKC